MIFREVAVLSSSVTCYILSTQINKGWNCIIAVVECVETISYYGSILGPNSPLIALFANAFDLNFARNVKDHLFIN